MRRQDADLEHFDLWFIRYKQSWRFCFCIWCLYLLPSSSCTHSACKVWNPGSSKRTSTVTFTDVPDSMCQAGRTSVTRRHSVGGSLLLLLVPTDTRMDSPLRSRLSRRLRASRGRTSWPSPPPCLPVIPVLCFPSRHRRGPSERPPGGVLWGNAAALMALLADSHNRLDRFIYSDCSV